jgi:hypothetical protein
LPQSIGLKVLIRLRKSDKISTWKSNPCNIVYPTASAGKKKPRKKRNGLCQLLVPKTRLSMPMSLSRGKLLGAKAIRTRKPP